MDILQSINDLLRNPWLGVLLTIVGLLSLLWKGRSLFKFLYKCFLKLTTYKTVDQKWINEWLRQSVTSKKAKPEDKNESEKICPECGSLVGQDNKEIVTVKDVAGHELMVIHKDCILRTKRAVFIYDKPFLKKKKVLKIGSLKNLWKLHGYGNELCVKCPRFMFVSYVIPEGVMYCLQVPKEVRPIEGEKKESILFETSSPDVKMMKAYKEGLWGEEVYARTFEASSKMENPHLYFLQFDTLAQIYVGPMPPEELRKRFEAKFRKNS